MLGLFPESYVVAADFWAPKIINTSQRTAVALHLQAAEGDKDAGITQGNKGTAEPLKGVGRNLCSMPKAASSASLHLPPAIPHFHQVFLNWLRDMVTSPGLTTHPFPTPGPHAKAVHPSAKGPSKVSVLLCRTLVQHLT